MILKRLVDLGEKCGSLFKSSVYALLVISLSLTLVACGDEGTPPPENTVGDFGAGEELFSNNCAACHGDDATGATGPNIQCKTKTDIDNAIDNVSAMSSLSSITDEERDSIADFLSTFESCISETTLTRT